MEKLILTLVSWYDLSNITYSFEAESKEKAIEDFKALKQSVNVENPLETIEFYGHTIETEDLWPLDRNDIVTLEEYFQAYLPK